MNNFVADTRKEFPCLCEVDIAVVGGSLAGISAALAPARAGRKVVLIEPRTYLGYEITATLRPWVAESANFPELLAECVRISQTQSVGGEIPLHPDAVKTRLEDILLEAGVQLIYSSQAVGLCDQGVIIGNKSGRQLVACKVLVDATPTALLARLSGASFQDAAETALYRISLEFSEVAFQEEGQMVESDAAWEIPAHLSDVILRAEPHRGYRPTRHGYRHDHNLIELTLQLPRRVNNALSATQRYLKARHYAVNYASHLLWNDHHFRLAYLGTISQELFGPQAEPLLVDEPEWARELTEGIDLVGFPAVRFAGQRPNLWLLNDAARCDGEKLRDPVNACRIGEALGHFLKTGKVAKSLQPVEKGQNPKDTGNLLIREMEAPQRGRYPQVSVQQLTDDIPVAANVEVLVVGGGTSGAIATIAAAQSGAKTLVLEMNPGLGGTATYGGVHEYWAGYQHGFVRQSIGWVNKINDQLRYPRTYGLLGEWNIEAKIQALAEEAQAAGAWVMFNSLLIGAVVEDNRVLGAVAATPYGPIATLGQAVIDATGDGDVAAFAGAEFTYGSVRDHAVMWFSLPQFHSPGHTNNNFTSMVDISNVMDTTRAILGARRRGGNLHDHGTYVATRESRHIVGEVVQTLADQLRQRAWADVINLASSNNDIKGQISSDWLRIGLIPPNLRIENSYRMLLPKGLEGILVVGKALSVARDALPSVRMQPDFENLGGAAGLAAAQAVRKGVSLRRVDVRELQAQLVEIGTLPADVLTRELIELEYSDQALEQWIETFISDDRPWRELANTNLDQIFRERIALVELVTAGERVIPFLEAVLGRSEGPASLRVAIALALAGSHAGVDVLTETLLSRLGGDRLPTRNAFVMHMNKFAPDQAAMPDEANLLYALGLTADPRALAVWKRVAELIVMTVNEEDVWSQDKGIFAYVDALCMGAERLGDARAVPILQKLHSSSALRDKYQHEGFQANYLLERPAYLEVVIGRALARCGSPAGALVLINYLTDVRALLAEQAHDELIAVSGQDFGKNPRAWSEWLESAGDNLEPKPWEPLTDAQAAWGEKILIDPG